MRITKSKTAVVVAGTAIAALVGGTAFAYFTSTGTGGGTASVGTSTAFVITVKGPVGGPLYPGVGSQTFSYSVTNPGPGPANLASVVATINKDNAAGDVAAAGCKSADFTISISGDGPGVLQANQSNNGTGVITLKESGENQDACKGTSPGFTLTAS